MAALCGQRAKSQYSLALMPRTFRRDIRAGLTFLRTSSRASCWSFAGSVAWSRPRTAIAVRSASVPWRRCGLPLQHTPPTIPGSPCARRSPAILAAFSLRSIHSTPTAPWSARTAACGSASTSINGGRGSPSLTRSATWQGRTPRGATLTRCSGSVRRTHTWRPARRAPSSTARSARSLSTPRPGTRSVSDAAWRWRCRCRVPARRRFLPAMRRSPPGTRSRMQRGARPGSRVAVSEEHRNDQPKARAQPPPRVY